MTSTVGSREATDRLADGLAERLRAGTAFFEAESERLARLCHRMAERFARGGRLVAFGGTPADRSDARHVAVEFVHPVIVGKRALPAIGITAEGGGLERQVTLAVEPQDMVIGFGCDDESRAALAHARERGCLTIAFAPIGAEWAFLPPSEDPAVRQELVETLYHVLWELVHIFFDHRGLLDGRDARPVHQAGASSFLYPFLGEQETDLAAVLEDVRRSILTKAEEVGRLRAQTLEENAEGLAAAARALRADLDRGARLLVLGNGGSATDSMDLVADLQDPIDPRWSPRRAMDLTQDPAILTAVANDIGIEAIFTRQVIAHGRVGDVLIAISTSGNSANVIAALAEARSRGLRTLALVGYDGGRIQAERLADHVIVTRSEHIPRIQEAQASAYHLLRELIEMEPPA